MRKRKSYYFTILVHFLVGSLIPIIAILVMNMQSLEVIKKQTVLSNQNTLQQVVRLLDSEVEEMTDSCMEIASLADVKRYPAAIETSPGTVGYQRYRLKLQLGNYNNKKLKDVLLYYPDDRYVISGVNSAMELSDYFNIYYEAEGTLREDFFANLEQAPGYVSLRVLNAWGRNRYLCITMQTRASGQKKVVVSLLLDANYLSSLFRNRSEEQDGSLLLFNQDKQLLLSDNRKPVGYTLEGYNGSSAPYDTTFGDEDYTMQVYHSEAINCYFAFATPSEYFWDQHSQMQNFSILCVVLCAVVSLLLAWIASRRTYRPVREFVDTLRSQNAAVGSEKLKTNEFEFMKDYFHNETRENRKLSKENSANKRDRLLLQVLEGKIQEENGNADALERVGATLLSDQFVSGLIQVEASGDWKHNEISFALHNVFEEIFNREDLGYLLYVAEYRYAFLINLAAGADAQHVCAMLQEGKTFLQSHFGLEMTVGCSKVEEGLQEIESTYEQAKSALRYRYIFGKNALISYYDLQERQFTYRNTTQGNLYARLEQHINRTEDAADAARFVFQIFEECNINRAMSMETMECFKFDVVNSIIHIGLEYGLSQEGRQDKVQELLGKETLGDFAQCLAQVLEQLRQERLEQQESAGICANSRAYIEKNYWDPQMSMSHLSESMGVSASYLSRMYKQKYGTSVLQDITRIRLVNAKRLLQETELSIAEISKETGFSNSNVFIKVFKKWEGMTPGQYKELYRSTVQ